MLEFLVANCLIKHKAVSMVITIVIAAKAMKGMTAMGRKRSFATDRFRSQTPGCCEESEPFIASD